MDKTAYLSVYDKTGVVELARELNGLGFELYSSGSTFKLLSDSEVEVEEIRYSPPVPSSVLKAIAGKTAVLSENGVEVPKPHIVVANLYPIASIVGQEEFAIGELSNYLDQANCAVLRAAARDFEHMITLCDPADYASALASLKDAGGLTPEAKRELAAKAWKYLAYYDATVAQYLSETHDPLAEETVMSLKKINALSYGENPHQKASFYALSGARARGLNAAKMLSGPKFDLNHYLDMDTAFELAAEFSEPVCVISKHARPAAVASAPRIADGLKAALKADAAGALGATAAFNRQVDAETAGILAGAFIETVIAPDYAPEALKILKGSGAIRAVELAPPVLSPHEVEIYSVAGGLLVETKDNSLFAAELKSAAKRKPTEDELRSMKLAYKTVKYAKTYSVVLAQGNCTLAVSAAESSTYDAVRSAVAKVKEKHPILDFRSPVVMASDAALPLKTLREALGFGVSAVIQPGGWREDAECAALCDEKNAAMIFAGLRHYKH